MTDVPINQKEYLKKYLGIGKAPGEKKKKKKKPATTSRVQIIDDDADANIPFVTIEDENADEYAPQVVAIIDERPLALRFNDVTNEPLWQPIGTVENTGPNEQKQMISSFKIAPKVNEKVLKSDKSPQRKKRHSPPQNSNSNSMSPVRNVVIKEERKSECRFDDKSPPRKTRSENDYSPLRRIKQEVESPPRRNIEDDTLSRNAENEDYSPPRRRKKRENSPPRRSRWDDDSSLSRSHTNEDILPPKENTEGDSSPPRRGRKDDDISPPRKSKKGDYSPPRRSRKEEDISPPRRNRKNDFLPPKRSIKAKESSPPRRHRKDGSPSIKNKKEVGSSPPRRNRKENNSPPRRSKKENENSPPRRNRNEDNFSPRRNKKTDNSPPRKRKEYIEENTNDSSVRSRTPDKSPPRRPRSGGSGREEKGSNRMEKTLDGKSAGLQNARELIEETRNFKKREDSLFKNLSKDVSGQSAETVHRDRRTGHIRNLEEEEERKRKKREEEEKNKEKYERWGRGLAQVESREQKLQEQLHEMSKPLARYADDEDLERYLKEQEREGDPMLAYIRKKKKKKMAEAGVEIKPQFEGEFMPNRYGIRPGHRWDGVDRSNGYEKKWFEIQNQKRAIQEDSYKWSTEDM